MFTRACECALSNARMLLPTRALRSRCRNQRVELCAEDVCVGPTNSLAANLALRTSSAIAMRAITSRKAASVSDVASKSLSVVTKATNARRIF